MGASIIVRLWPETAYPRHLRFWPFKSALMTGEWLYESVQPIPSGVTLRYVVAGEWTVSMRGETHKFGSGCVFCTVPSDAVTFKQILPDVTWEWYELQFNGPETESFLAEFGLSPESPVIEPERPQRALRLFKRIHELMESHRAAELMAATFGLLAACGGRPAKESSGGRGGLVKKAKLLLESEMLLGGGVEKLSSRLGVERTTLYRAFKEETGLSPHAYIDKLRLVRADELLWSTDIPVSSVASQTGFPDVKYFIGWFKAKRGLPPSAWRKGVKTGHRYHFSANNSI
jgi:AraC-like DNA-binding protein